MKARKVLSILLSLAMTLSLVNVTAFAENEDPSGVAEIGGGRYETLAEAIAAVPTDGTETTITMIADETIATEQTGEVITIASGKNIVLDLNGHTISGTSTQKSNYFIANYGTLEIKDDTETGKITFCAVADSGYSVENVTVYNENGTLTLTSGTIENTTNGGLSYAVKNSSNAWGHSVVSTFNMTGGSLLGAKTDNTLRVYQNTGIGWKVESKNYVNISGGYIENGIFFDMFLYTQGQNATDFDAADITKGCVIDSALNISGGTINGLVDLKVRHPYSTAINITGGDFTNAKLRVRKYASEYGTNLTAGTIPEPTEPMFSISGGNFTFASSDMAFQNQNWSSYTDAYILTGGTYNVNPAATYIAEGYEAVDNGDGTWTVTAAAPVDVYTAAATAATGTLSVGGAGNTFRFTITKNGTKLTKTAEYSAEKANWQLVYDPAYIELTNTAASASGIGYTVKALKAGTTTITFRNIADPTITASTVLTNKHAVSITYNRGTDASGNKYLLEKGTLTITKITFDGVAYTGADLDTFLASHTLTAEGNATIDGLNVTPNATGDVYIHVTDKEDATVTARSGLLKFITGAAQIGNDYYATLTLAFKAAQNGDTITLISDITEKVNFGGTAPRATEFALALDLNGHTFTAPANEDFALRVQYGVITIKDSVGTGAIRYGRNSAILVDHLAGDYPSKVIIESGTFTGKSTVVQTGYPGGTGANYKYYGGELEVLGGTFVTVADTNENYDDNGNFRYTLNMLDMIASAYAGGIYSESSITVKGGTFNGFDPANNAAEGAGTNFVAEGYESVNNGDGTWTVVPATAKVAQIGNVKYETLAAAIAVAQDGDTIELLTDVNVSETVEITKSITLDGGNHTLTTTATRGIWIASSNVNVTIENMEIVSSNNKMERSIQVNPDCDGVILNLNNITTIATYYTVNICGSVDGLELNINNCDLTGWGVINLWGNNGTVNVSNSTLVGINDKSYNADGWNDFGVIILEGDTTGQTDEHSTAYDVTVTNCGITATSTKGNTQYVLLHNNPSAYNSLALNSCTITLGTNCEFYCDDAVESVTKIKDTFISGTNNVPTLPEGYVYVPIDDSYLLITQAVAEVNGTRYATLADAIAAANVLENATVTLLRDYDMEANESGYGYTTSYVAEGETTPRNNMIELSGAGLTLDLGGHALTNLFNNTFTVTGENVTIQNGTMELGQLYYGSYSTTKGVTLYATPTYGSYVVFVNGASDFVINNLTTFGGINVSASTATINNLSFSGLSFYAVCSQSGSVVTLNGGSYNKAITGAANYLFWVQSGSVMNITGGTFTKGTTTFINGVKPVITGGTFDFDPTNSGVAEGYEAASIGEGLYQVGKLEVSEITPAQETTEGYDATYTITKQVVSTDGEEDILAENNAITVNVKAITENTPASDTTIEKIDSTALQTIISQAIEASDTSATEIEVQIEVVRDEPALETTGATPTITYEVHPVVKAFVGEELIGTEQIGNDSLAENASFTITLPVPDVLVNANGQVKVSHISEDYGTDVNVYDVAGEAGNYTVTFTVTHFSSFELAIAELEGTGSADLGASLSLTDNIEINLYVTNLKDVNGVKEVDPGRFKVAYTFNGERTETTLTSADSNRIVVATCAAKEIGDIVTIELYYDDTLVRQLDYSARMYCEGKIKNSSEEKLVELCYALLDYGAYAQLRFDYKTQELANETYTRGTVESVSIPGSYAAEVSGATYIVNDIGASLSLESKTEVNVYFISNDGSTAASGNYAVYVNDTQMTISDTKEGMICANIPGIVAKDLGETIEIIIDKAGEKMTVSYSPLSYAYRNQSDSTEGNVVKALYKYYLAAASYFEE